MLETPRITRQLAAEAEQAAIGSPSFEACGIFVFPVGDTAKFLELPNVHTEPDRQFQINYEDIKEQILGAYGDRPSLIAEITLFHTHPFGVGQPSRADELAIEKFAKEMDGHKMLHPTFRHMIFSLWDMSWWWFDLESFGRVAWAWPDV